MQEVSGLLTRLNLATRQYHADVDGPWLDLMRPTVSVADYLGQLVRTYGFVAPFESACKYTPGLGRVLDIGQLMRAGLIAQDLLSLGLTASQVASVPYCPAITTYRSPSEALGWAYVIERSTLLHDGIRRHIARQLPEAARAMSYLAAYDGRVGDHWTTFGRIVDRAGTTPQLANEIINAAHDGFRVAKQWFKSVASDARFSLA